MLPCYRVDHWMQSQKPSVCNVSLAMDLQTTLAFFCVSLKHISFLWNYVCRLCCEILKPDIVSFEFMGNLLYQLSCQVIVVCKYQPVKYWKLNPSSICMILGCNVVWALQHFWVSSKEWFSKILYFCSTMLCRDCLEFNSISIVKNSVSKIVIFKC